MIRQSLVDMYRTTDMNLLLILSVLLHEQGVSRAAETLSMSQPAVSRHLERLRAMFDDPLLVRQGNGMVLTSKARELIPMLDDLVEHAKRIVQGSDRDNPETFNRSVNVACSEYAQITFIELLAEIRRVAPNLSVQLHPMPIGGEAQRKLADGTLDVLVGLHTDSLSNFRITPLYEEPFVCLTRGSPASAAPGSISFDEFCARPHLDVSPTGHRVLGSRIDDAVRKMGGARNVAWTISSFVSAPQLVADTDMISVVPRKIAQRLVLPENVHVVELGFPPPMIDVVMYWHNVTQHDPVCIWLRQLVVQHLGMSAS